ncbi:MAG: hypothetical protein C4523_14355 [Myxococcales bacterium]|nr:MAG: hypothetical protein C4523_14355 [Myxococcales bacterium]
MTVLFGGYGASYPVDTWEYGIDTDCDGKLDVNDPCPLDNPDDSDGDGVCDSDDVCPGFDDNLDCDSDGTPDGCEVDCQPNGTPDDCDLINQTSQDLNGNGVPDECDECVTDADCHDDDVCTRDVCQVDTCVFEPKRYGDIDGNGFITLADLFCVLDGFAGDFSNCSFEDDDIHGTGNPIACVPPAVSPCCPNGVIGLADLFAVLDAFAGEDPCCGG